MSATTPKIYYHVPDWDQPSWGIATLYHHVEILNRHGFDATILHRNPGFKCSWLDLDVPIRYLNDSEFAIDCNDFFC